MWRPVCPNNLTQLTYDSNWKYLRLQHQNKPTKSTVFIMNIFSISNFDICPNLVQDSSDKQELLTENFVLSFRYPVFDQLEAGI